MSEPAKGILAMALACAVWGFSPLFYKLLVHVPPLEILAHRTIWSFVFFAAVLLLQGRLVVLARALSSWRSAAVLGFAALMISTNWFFYISSVQLDKVIEASMAYYIFPLVSVLLGALVFRERLGRTQLLAVALAALAVIVLTAGLGVAPWIALVMAFTFGLYGVAKKSLELGPVVSVTAEVLLLSPIAVIVLWQVHAQGQGAFGSGLSDSVLLALSGLVTAIPLILFSYATRRVSLATVGLVQYLNPTLQFFCATLIFREPFGFWHSLAFAMIWTALAIYSAATLRQERRRSSLSQRS
jgi:chloramphenicol-sensitive protein RarD